MPHLFSIQIWYIRIRPFIYTSYIKSQWWDAELKTGRSGGLIWQKCKMVATHELVILKSLETTHFNLGLSFFVMFKRSKRKRKMENEKRIRLIEIIQNGFFSLQIEVPVFIDSMPLLLLLFLSINKNGHSFILFWAQRKFHLSI